MSAPAYLTVAEFLDWTSPPPFEKHRWHLLDGLPTMMPVLPVQQAILHSQAGSVISTLLRQAKSIARCGMMVGVVPEGPGRNLYVPCVGVRAMPGFG